MRISLVSLFADLVVMGLDASEAKFIGVGGVQGAIEALVGTKNTTADHAKGEFVLLEPEPPCV